MPRKNAKKTNSSENDGQEFFAAIAQIEKEKGIPAGYMMEKITQALASGQVCVALMREGHFTSGGHFIVLRGVTLEGKILVADPNSRQRSLIAWDPQLIIDELSHSRSSGAPLWCISTLPQQN